MIQRLLAQMTVTDLGPAEAWYGRLFGSDPDARPTEDIIEWHLDHAYGVQISAEPDRAGRSSLVLDVDDLDDAAGRLTGVGIVHDGPTEAKTMRVLLLTDPDGNRVVLASPFR